MNNITYVYAWENDCEPRGMIIIIITRLVVYINKRASNTLVFFFFFYTYVPHSSRLYGHKKKKRNRFLATWGCAGSCDVGAQNTRKIMHFLRLLFQPMRGHVIRPLRRRRLLLLLLLFIWNNLNLWLNQVIFVVWTASWYYNIHLFWVQQVKNSIFFMYQPRLRVKEGRKEGKKN